MKNIVADSFRIARSIALVASFLILGACRIGGASVESILIWTLGTAEQFEWPENQINAWLAENTNATLQVEYYGIGELQSRFIDNHAAGGKLPDLVWGLSSFLVPFADAGAVITTDTYFAAADFVETDQYLGNYWSIPVAGGEPLTLFYNKSIIPQANVPVNMDELLALDPVDLPAGVDWWLQSDWSAPFWVVPFYLGYGGSPFSTEDGSVSMDNQAMVDALNLVKAIVDSGIGEFVPRDAGGGYDGMHADFTGGLSAMAINGGWAIDSYRETLGTNLGIARIPEIVGVGWPKPYVAGSYLYVPDGLDLARMEVVGQLIEYLTGMSFQAVMVENWNRLPALNAVADGGFDDALLQEYAGQASVGVPAPINPDIQVFWSAFGPALNEFLSGIGTAAEAAAAMQAAADAQQ